MLVRLDGDGAWLQGEAGPPSRFALLDVANRWSGDYLTLWRAPPGLRNAPVLPDEEPASARWLDSQLDAAGVPADTGGRRARVSRFQRSEGLQADGRAGPLTLMRLARVADPREPRLSARP